jgi:cytochrome c553
MKRPISRAAAGLGALAAGMAMAQNPLPAGPAFAPAHLTGSGPRNLAMTCAPCHGTQGKTVEGSAFRPLAGRTAGETIEILAQFKAGTRPATVMHQIAKGFSDDEIAAMAAYFEQQR